MDFVVLVLKLYPIQVVISLPLWIKLTMGQLLLFFLCNFSSFFSYVGGILVTNHFSLLLIDRYILAIQQIITHEEHFRYSFWSVAIFWTASKSFWLTSSTQKVNIFCCFDVCSMQPPQIFQVQAKILMLLLSSNFTMPIVSLILSNTLSSI